MKSFLLLILAFSATISVAQVNVELTVEAGTSATDCLDVFSGPDPMWSVEANGEGWVDYPQQGACFAALPNLQYTTSYACPADVPAQLEVCFRAFENDAIIPCFILPDCEESICANFDIPAPGQSASYTLAIPAGTSTGEVNFTITVGEGPSSNDELCSAAILGLLARGDTLGDYNQGLYSNLCATNANEPNPFDDGGFNNENGIWFQFTTEANPGSLVLIEALSDPENTGDFIDMQMALYSSDNDACDGNFQLLSWTSDNSTNDAFIQLRCPQPNTTYFVLIDGAISGAGSEEGVIGIQVSNVDIDDAPDARCDALDLGAIPEGGSVGLDAPLGNFCATAVNDPFSPSFVTQSSVWFRFLAPPSGHVLIEAESARSIDSIGIQLALYRAFQDNCNFSFQHLTSSYTIADLDEQLEATCLYAGQPYYVMIDGDATNNRGIFDLTITDAGDITPVAVVDTTICFGDTYIVGSSAYTTAGTYADTLPVFQGCDSIVISNISVLDPIVITVTQTEPAIGLGNANGIANVTAVGGAGNFTFEWCDGSIGAANTMLVGGATCCVVATDERGCMNDTCFLVDYVTDIIPSFQGDTLACNGDEDGQVLFSAVNGEPPYTYTWQNGDNSINGAGIINAEGEEVILPGLPAGAYTIRIRDEYFDTSFVAEVLEPEPLVLDITEQLDASCFRFCDGQVASVASGGVGGYGYNWSNGAATPGINGLCAGAYSVTLEDANGCIAEEEIIIEEPAEFIATPSVLQAVSCFDGSDGAVDVETNGVPIAYAWNTGAQAAAVNNLPTGTYTVTVTNQDGCLDTADVFVPQPAEPVSVAIVEQQGVSCKGEADAVLEALPAGPGATFTYLWSNGAAGATASGLPAGTYSVVLANEKDCQATAEITIGEPEELQLALSAVNITCVSGENGGRILIDDTQGGTPPFVYSLDGIIFDPLSEFNSLFAGTYTVVAQDANGCEVMEDATVEGAPVLTVELGESDPIQLGDSIRLEAQSNSTNLDYTWIFPDSTGVKEAGKSLWVSPTASNGYYVEVFDTVTLCRASDFIFIAVKTGRRVFIPNAFSPNEDGRNDSFTIYADDAVVQVNYLRIFSRNGSLVYEDTDFMPNDDMRGWDGTFNGQELDPAVFVYVAELEFIDGRTEIFQGDVVLMK